MFISLLLLLAPSSAVMNDHLPPLTYHRARIRSYPFKGLPSTLRSAASPLMLPCWSVHYPYPQRMLNLYEYINYHFKQLELPVLFSCLLNSLYSK